MATSRRRAVGSTAVAMAVAALVTVLPATPASAGPGNLSPTPDEMCFAERSVRAFWDQPDDNVVEHGMRVQWAGRENYIREVAGNVRWLGASVDRLYAAALDRAPDSGGRAFWVAQLGAGTTVNRFGALVYGANEFYRRSGGTTTGFVTQLYRRILGRSPDAAGLASWSAVVERRGRATVAAAFFASAESRRSRVTFLYRRLLKRAPDAAGLAHWTEALRTVNDVELAIALALSPEFTNRANSCALESKVTRVVTGGDVVEPMGLSADGTRAALIVQTGTERNAVVDDRTTGTTQQINPSGCNVAGLAQSTDGRFAVFSNVANSTLPDAECGTTQRVWRWDRTTGVATAVGTGIVRAVTADGSRILVSDPTAGDTLRLLGPGSATVTLPVTLPVSAGRPALSADGSTIVVPGKDIFVWKEATGVATKVASGLTTPASTVLPTVAVRGDGLRAWFWSDDPTLVHEDTNNSFDVFRVTLDSLQTFPITPVGVPRVVDHPSLAITPDESIAVYATGPDAHPGSGGNQIVRNEVLLGATFDLTSAAQPASVGAMSADGATVLFASSDPRLGGDVGPGALESYRWSIVGVG